MGLIYYAKSIREIIALERKTRKQYKELGVVITDEEWEETHRFMAKIFEEHREDIIREDKERRAENMQKIKSKILYWRNR